MKTPASAKNKSTRAGNPRRLLLAVNQLESFFNHRMPLAHAAKTTGWDVHIAIHEAGEAREIARKSGINDLTFHHWPLARSFASPARETETLRALNGLVAAIQPDIVHAFTLKPALYAALVSRWRRQPTVMSITGVGSFFLGQGLKERLIRAGLTTALRLALGSTRQIAIVQNPDDQQLVRRQFAMREDHIVLIPGSGVDLTRFAPAPELAPPPVQIVLAARMLADKGVREFAQAAHILKDRGLNARFVLAGGLDPANRTAISEAELRQWQAQGDVTWLGQVADMAQLYRQSHIACLPSYREGLPKSLLEAAACGLPCVTTDVPGCRDIVVHEKTGLLVPARDAKNLAEALERLIEHAPERQHFGSAGRQMVERGYSNEAISAAILETYARLLANQPA